MGSARFIYHSKAMLKKDNNFPGIVIIGAGLSLDYCNIEIDHFLAADYLFILTDRIAVNFIRRYPDCKRVIISVEPRSHNFLRPLKREIVWLWEHGNAANLVEEQNTVQLYSLKGVSGDTGFQHIRKYPGIPLLNLPSSGSVGGIAVALAISMVLTMGKSMSSEIIFLGLDFSYPDLLAYSKMGVHSRVHDRLYTLETQHAEGVFARTSALLSVNGNHIRTSYEFYEARQNLTALLTDTLNRYPGKFQFFDYSMPGILCEGVDRRVPAAMALTD